MVKLLYVDDDPVLARLVAKVLGRDGITIVHALSGAEAFEQLGRDTFDVIALDHNLGHEVGIDVIEQLGKLPECPPIIYVTGSDDSHVAVRALKSGAVDYVWKDVQGHYKELLAQAIKGAILQRKLEQEARETQLAILKARDRAEMLLGEVNHRVANSLAMVASLASLQASVISDPAAKTALKEMKARIIAVAGVHKRLYTSSDVSNVDFGIYLKGLGEELSAMAGLPGEAARINVRAAPGLMVPTDRAISLGIVVTELVTNALKYAYPQGQSGEVRVSVRAVADAQIELVVEDDGVGWTGTGQVKGSGLGSRVIQSIASALDGTFQFEPQAKGTRARFVCPLLTSGS